MSIEGSYQQETALFITRSSTKHVVDRKYLKLLDVASYIGGIFPVLLGSLFFM